MVGRFSVGNHQLLVLFSWAVIKTVFLSLSHFTDLTKAYSACMHMFMLEYKMHMKHALSYQMHTLERTLSPRCFKILERCHSSVTVLMFQLQVLISSLLLLPKRWFWELESLQIQSLYLCCTLLVVFLWGCALNRGARYIHVPYSHCLNVVLLNSSIQQLEPRQEKVVLTYIKETVDWE